jgi:hypothetical protein
MTNPAVATLPQPLDLLIYQGDDYTTTVNAPTSISLTGATVTAQIRLPVPMAPPPATVPNQAPAATFTCTVNGQAITLVLPNAQSAPLQGNYVWDVQAVLPNGNIHTVAAGKVVVTPQVTV